MTRHEMSQMRQSFLAQAITDVKERLVNLMDRNQMDVNQVANSLSLSTAEVNAILNENVDALSLKAFATILIINGLVINIEEVNQNPFGMGAAPMPPMPNAHGYRPRPPFVPKANNFSQLAKIVRPTNDSKNQKRDANGRFAPKRDSNGRFAKNNPISELFVPNEEGLNFEKDMARPNIDVKDNLGSIFENVDFDAMTRNDLVQMVKNNHWESEIDLEEAGRSEIINFLNFKKDNNETTNDNDTDDSHVFEGLKAILRNHPELVTQLSSKR